MKKKLIFDISLCVILFFALSVIYTVFSHKTQIPSAVYESNTSVSDTAKPITQNGITSIGGEISLSKCPEYAHPGDNVRIEIKGTPGALYDINVYYPSGLSTAKAFADKYANENGIAAWEFKLSSKTSAEKLRIVIRSEKSYLAFYIPVEKTT